MAAYAAASLDATRVRKLVGMAVPYGPQLQGAFVTNGDQQRRSWYMFFFQAALAEAAVALDDFAFIDRLWREWSPGYELPEAERAALKETFRAPGVLTEPLGFYRQLFTPPPDEAARALEARASGAITVPSLYLHGADDNCMSVELSDGMDSLFTNGLERIVVPGAGHSCTSLSLSLVTLGNAQMYAFDAQRSLAAGEDTASQLQQLGQAVLSHEALNDVLTTAEVPVLAELPDTKWTDFHLTSAGRANTADGDGVLTTAAPADTGHETNLYDPRRPVPSAGGASMPTTPGFCGPVHQRTVAAREDVLRFATPLLDEAVEVTGPVSLTLHVSSSAVDTDLTAELVDVFPDGKDRASVPAETFTSSSSCTIAATIRSTS